MIYIREDYEKANVYSKTYKIDEKMYDINFYRNGDKIICELVYNIDE